MSTDIRAEFTEWKSIAKKYLEIQEKIISAAYTQERQGRNWSVSLVSSSVKWHIDENLNFVITFETEDSYDRCKTEDSVMIPLQEIEYKMEKDENLFDFIREYAEFTKQKDIAIRTLENELEQISSPLTNLESEKTDLLKKIEQIKSDNKYAESYKINKVYELEEQIGRLNFDGVHQKIDGKVAELQRKIAEAKDDAFRFKISEDIL